MANKLKKLIEQAIEPDIINEIIKWFIKNPYPKDKEVHAFANRLGIDKHKFEEYIYKILSDILTEGKSKGFTGTYDSKQMGMGRKVEMEHTTIVSISEKISRDHLAEIPDYYTRLAKMEKEAGVED